MESHLLKVLENVQLTHSFWFPNGYPKYQILKVYLADKPKTIKLISNRILYFKNYTANNRSQ